MKKLREERKKIKEKQDLGDTPKNSEEKVMKQSDTLNTTDEQIKVLYDALLDLSLEV